MHIYIYYYALTPNNFKKNLVFLINVHNSGFVPKSNVFKKIGIVDDEDHIYLFMQKCFNLHPPSDMAI